VKRAYLFLIFLYCIPTQARTFSKTFFSVIPPFQAGSPEKETMFRDAFTANTGRRCMLEAVVFGGKSQDNNDLARYFLPFGKAEILVAEAGAASVADRDVDAVHLNINHLAPGNTFQSKVCFNFKQSFGGVGFAVRSQLSSDDAAGWWVGASSPLTIVSNEVWLREIIENPGGTLEATRVATVKDAFNQASWNYGKIDNCSHSKIRFADVELQLGYKWGEADECHGDMYTGVVIPTGNKPCGVYIFEPVVGNNQHFGILFGGTVAKDLYATENQSINFLLNMNGRYLFHNTQRRSFDLQDKHWGRYMEVYENLNAAQAAFDAATVAAGDHGSPGINVFTQDMEVKPGFMGQVNAALLYKERKLQVELGYNLLARQAEEVRLKCWNEGPALVSSLQDGSTTKFRTINHAATGDEGIGTVAETYKPLTLCDLDLNSAAHPAVVGHELYGALGLRINDSPDGIPVLSLGGSWKFSESNTFLDRWAVWGKIGVMY
jgi:hypothetical protein